MLQSPTVGLAPWSPVLAESAELCPAQSRWLVADLDLDQVRRVRAEGQVFIRRDWPEQFDPARVFRRD